MSFKRPLSLAIIALAAVSATAAAQAAVAPPAHDAYLQPLFFNDETHPLGNHWWGFAADTTGYTTQGDMYNPPSSGGPSEPTHCDSTSYGNTIWSVFYSHKWGLMTVSVTGKFDAVIGVVPFDNPDSPAPHLDRRLCGDSLSGSQEDGNFIIRPKRWYAIQVGGTAQKNTGVGGEVEVDIHQDRSPQTGGNVTLNWHPSKGQAKIRSLEVSAPVGANVAVTCTHHGCGAIPKPFTVQKGSFTTPVGANGPSPATNAPAGAEMRPAGVSFSDSTKRAHASGSATHMRGAVAHAAKKYELLAGRKLKNGTKIENRISRTGYIGRYFSYNVSKGA